MNTNRIDEAKRILNHHTPLKNDCGQICRNACCKGDSTMGMLLFPNETTTLTTVETDGRKYVICNGHCNRNERPLSCMIFPFFPSINESGEIKTIYDYRGYGICPLIPHSDEIKFSRRFIRRVEKVGKLLSEDPESTAFMIKITTEINKTKKMIDLFNDKLK